MRRAIHAFFREPIVHFLLVGALLYGASVLHARVNDPGRIVITKADVVRLEQRFRQQFGVLPSAKQLESLIQRHERDEVLYREGMALGLGEGDEVIRRRIVQKMAFLSEDDRAIAPPTATDLRAYYEANAPRYRSPARVTFSQLYYTHDGVGETSALERATRALVLLRGRPGVESQPESDPFWDGERFERVDRVQVERVFGRTDLAARVFELPAGGWFGPLRSGYGWHLVHIEMQEPPRLASFAEIELELRSDWEQDQRAQHKQDALEQLMRGYRFVREGTALSNRE